MESSSLPRTLVLRTAGTNCDLETAYAFERAGSAAQRVHLNRVLENPALLKEFQILAIPGGFSYGDDIAAGRIFANQLRSRLSDAMRQFVEDRKPIIGICNGFQVLIKTGLLPGPLAGRPASAKEQSCTLAHNDGGRFIDRWVRLASPADNRCIWTRTLASAAPDSADPVVEPESDASGADSSTEASGADSSAAAPAANVATAPPPGQPPRQFELPIAHGEGKFIPADDSIRSGLWENHQVALVYAAPDGSAAPPSSPDNPNGSIDGIAGICDATGLIFGLMPHPERFVDPTQHPSWTDMQIWQESRSALAGEGAGLQIFRNAVEFIKMS